MAESETLSVDTSTENQDDPLTNISDEELYQLVEDTRRANEVLRTETLMFDKCVKRLEPRGPGGMQQASFAGTATTPSQSSHDLVVGGGTTGRVGRKRSKSRSSTMERMLRLTAEQKCDIAQREIEDFRDDIEKRREESEKVLDTFKAVMEESDMRFAEIKKAFYEFDRDIMKGAVNARTDKVIAEKVQRYFEDKLRARDALVEKLRLKNSTLKVQMKKLHLQLKQKEEMGEVLHEVDFNQLKIENQQYIEKIDERNQELLRQKVLAGNTLQILNHYKKKLHQLTKDSEALKGDTAARQDLLSRIDAETELVEEERAKAESINRKLRQQLADYKVPDVMEYVSEKADLYEVQKKVKSWERKVEIAEMALKTHRKAWNQMQMASHQSNHWPALTT